VRDYDIPEKDDEFARYNLTWRCININTQGKCITVENITLDFSEFDNQSFFKIENKTLPSYNGYDFFFNAVHDS
jgi:hypothetical protein